MAKKPKLGDPEMILSRFGNEFKRITKLARASGIIGEDEVILPEVKVNSYVAWKDKPLSDEQATEMLQYIIAYGNSFGISDPVISKIKEIRNNLKQPLEWWAKRRQLRDFLWGTKYFQALMRDKLDLCVKPENPVGFRLSSDGRPLAFIIGTRTDRLKID